MKKDLIAIIIVVFLVIFLIKGTKIQSVDDYYLTHIDDIKEDSKTVYLTIRCDTILDNYDSLDESLKNTQIVPSDGMILSKTEYVLRDKDTVFSILDRAVRYNKIHMECSYNKVFDSVYVEGINNLYEYSCGPNSGWMFKVNNKYPDKGCDKYLLNDKDEIEWVYTCDLGRDIEYSEF